MELGILDPIEQDIQPLQLRREGSDFLENQEENLNINNAEAADPEKNHQDLDDFFGDPNELEFLRSFNQEVEFSLPTYGNPMEKLYQIESKNTLKKLAFYNIFEMDRFHVKCKICFKFSTNYHEIKCKHAYCTECFIQFCYFLFESFKIFPDELKCPECETVFDEADFIRHLKHEDEVKLHALREKIKFAKLVNEEKAKPCPMPDCPGIGHVITGQDMTACIKCRTSLCISCGLCVHPGVTCEENLQLKDHQLELFITSQNMKKCPTCGVLVEKSSGCQFLYCSSLICKGNSFLCNLCGKKLTEQVHHTHFKKNGPYGDSCNTLDGIEDT